MQTTLPTPPEETSVGNHFIANYPPFSCWSPDHIPAYEAELEESANGRPLSFYVHLPFCRQRCHYCYFRTYPRRTREDIDRYIQALIAEFALYQKKPAVKGRPIRSVYFGGGTPSYLEPEQMRHLLGGLQEQQSWDALEEGTFECEPDTTTAIKSKLLKQYGITRVSIGFQSLNDEILRRSGRNVTVGDCIQAYHLAREVGFEEINVDLIAGLPGETDETWLKTIEKVVELRPDCVTIYQLELTYNSGLYASMKGGREVELATWPKKQQWVDQAFSALESLGYGRVTGYMVVRDPKTWKWIYPVETFWKGEDLLSVGESSFGYINGVHYQNRDRFDSYLEAIDQEELPLRRALQLTEDEKLRREIILQLKTGHLDPEYFRCKFGVNLLKDFAVPFAQLREAGLLDNNTETIRLSRQGLLQVDRFLPLFYRPEHIDARYT
ncbi:MAG: coproporphyrinogen III oxidase family protein [Verrucomicrobia bacterium]|nr:coproporphyrinogen III oxidase family protein [Verrucomicrobiota bacterium]